MARCARSHDRDEEASVSAVESVCECCRKDETFEPEMTIYHGDNCDCYEHEEEHKHGCCCCNCPIPVDNNSCLCNQQMKYIIAQLISLYEGQTFVVNLGDGVTSTGVPDTILTDCNKGLLVLDYTVETVEQKDYINICEIHSLTILSSTYDTDIRYLCQPMCCSMCGCEESIRCTIDEGDTVDITTGGVELGDATVIKNKTGVIALTQKTNVIFVSTCKIQKFTID